MNQLHKTVARFRAVVEPLLCKGICKLLVDIIFSADAHDQNRKFSKKTNRSKCRFAKLTGFSSYDGPKTLIGNPSW